MKCPTFCGPCEAECPDKGCNDYLSHKERVTWWNIKVPKSKTCVHDKDQDCWIANGGDK